MGDENTYRPERSGQRKHSGRDEGITFYPSAGEHYFRVDPPALRICDECGDEEPLRSECLNCGRTGYLESTDG